jgi:hypothetical protein
MKRRARLLAMVALSACALLSIFLLIFACVHWHNWWSLFVILPYLIAFFLPAIYFGYDDEDTARDQTKGKMDPDSLRNCRELTWAISSLLLLSTYGIPVLAWYNSGFHWHGVLVVDGALTSALWAFVLWLRVFVITS